MDLQDINFQFNFNNFNPAEVQVDETINAVFVIDTSPSITAYVAELNFAFNDFVQTMQKSHSADKLMVSIIEFNDQPQVITGFQPITGLKPASFKPAGGATALYDAVAAGIRNALDYRQQLENSGIQVKTLVFIITDGVDNNSRIPANAVKKQLDMIFAEEKNMFSFVTVLFGVGNAAPFEKAQKAMGIQHLAKVGTSGAEIKRMIGIVSQSVSQAASGNLNLQF
jgi:uncharacterized protein YegL